MFSPSPCPGHYSWPLATMASADSCSLTIQITPYGAASSVSCLLIFVSYFTDKAETSIVCAGTLYRWPQPVFSLETKSYRMENRSPRIRAFTLLNRIPIGKFNRVNFRCTTAPFTVSPVPWALTCCAVLPGDSALYGVSVRRPTSLHFGFLQTLPRGKTLAFG